MDQLDRLIDKAAREIVRHYPSDALTTAVMDRIVSGRRPSKSGGFVWGSAAVAAAAMAMILLMREPPVGQRGPIREVASTARAPSVEIRENRGASTTVALGHPHRMPATLSEDEAALRDPAEIEPIDLPPVSVPAIEVEVTSEQLLAIEPIQIESLSND
jgi:hypothetical protein